MVRVSEVEPSALEVDFADGSILQDRTVHADVPFRGWFGIHVLNLPRFGPESWTVRVSGVEPSTLEVDIMDGSISRAGPSTLMA